MPAMASHATSRTLTAATSTPPRSEENCFVSPVEAAEAVQPEVASPVDAAPAGAAAVPGDKRLPEAEAQEVEAQSDRHAEAGREP